MSIKRGFPILFFFVTASIFFFSFDYYPIRSDDALEIAQGISDQTIEVLPNYIIPEIIWKNISKLSSCRNIKHVHLILNVLSSTVFSLILLMLYRMDKKRHVVFVAFSFAVINTAFHWEAYSFALLVYVFCLDGILNKRNNHFSLLPVFAKLFFLPHLFTETMYLLKKYSMKLFRKEINGKEIAKVISSEGICLSIFYFFYIRSDSSSFFSWFLMWGKKWKEHGFGSLNHFTNISGLLHGMISLFCEVFHVPYFMFVRSFNTLYGEQLILIFIVALMLFVLFYYYLFKWNKSLAALSFVFFLLYIYWSPFYYKWLPFCSVPALILLYQRSNKKVLAVLISTGVFFNCLYYRQNIECADYLKRIGSIESQPVIISQWELRRFNNLRHFTRNPNIVEFEDFLRKDISKYENKLIVSNGSLVERDLNWPDLEKKLNKLLEKFPEQFDYHIYTTERTFLVASIDLKGTESTKEEFRKDLQRKMKYRDYRSYRERILY